MGKKTFSILLLAGMFFLVLTAFHIAYPTSLKAIDNSSLGLDLKDVNLNEFQAKQPPTIIENIFRGFKYAIFLTVVSSLVFLFFFWRPITQNQYYLKENWRSILGFLIIIILISGIFFMLILFLPH
jgi:hypothetical protein